MSCAGGSAEGEWKDIYGDPVRPRRCGYEWPPDALQVAAWLAIIVMLILHYMVQIVFFERALFIVALVLTSIDAAVVVGTKIFLELYAQEDPAVFAKDLPRLAQDELTTEAAPPGMEPCVFCRRFVEQSCKHCSVCDKCVPGFDHHCRWLNSCVGRKNYAVFAVFMGCAWAGMLWVVALTLYTIQWSLRDIDGFKHRMATHAYYSNPRAFPAIVVFNFILLALTVAGAGALGKLILFHVQLRWRHQTTFEYIMVKRQRKKERNAYRSRSAAKNSNGCCALLRIHRRRNFKKHSRPEAEASAAEVRSSSEARPESSPAEQPPSSPNRRRGPPPTSVQHDANKALGRKAVAPGRGAVTEHASMHYSGRSYVSPTSTEPIAAGEERS